MKITSIDQLKVGMTIIGPLGSKCHIYAICGEFVWLSKSTISTIEELSDFEIEDPKWEPKDNEGYYYPALFDKDLCRGDCFYHTDESDKFAVERGLCFRTKEEAIAAAEKMLKALKNE